MNNMDRMLTSIEYIEFKKKILKQFESEIYSISF